MAKVKTNVHSYSTGFRDQKAGESDEAYYRYLARLADQRLSRIENYSKQEHFRGMKEYAYKNAMYDIRHIRGEDVKRFGTALPANKDGSVNQTELHRRMNAVQKFLEAPSSTKSGLVEIYKNRADTINRRYGNTGKGALSWEDLAKYYESERAEADKDLYGSKTVVRALGAVKRIANDPEKIKAAIAGDLRIAKDETVNQIALRMIENGLDPEEFK